MAREAPRMAGRAVAEGQGPMSEGISLGRDDEYRDFQRLMASYDAPAYVRRARRVERREAGQIQNITDTRPPGYPFEPSDANSAISRCMRCGSCGKVK